MSSKTITLLTLEDMTEASIIKNGLEKLGITCFMNNKRYTLAAKPPGNNIDIKVYLKDLPKALDFIEADFTKDL